MNQITNKIPVSFHVISVLALIWNLMGLYSFFMQSMMSDEMRSSMTGAEQALYDSFPWWMTALYGIAVLTGVMGSIGLLLRKRWARPFFLCSLIAVILQMVGSLVVTDALSVYGAQVLMMPLIIVVIAAYLWYYSGQSIAKGWIS